MLSFFLELLPILLSSLIVFVLIYYQFPTSILQQISVGFLILLLVIFIRAGKSNQSPLIKRLYISGLAFLGSGFSLLLVLATGGFYSPFLILIHLFGLAASFLLDFSQATLFLLAALGLLSLNVTKNDNLQRLFTDDPWTVILYVTSFLVIIPIAQTLTRTYHLKDAITKKLGNILTITSSREDSILQGLNDLVIFTDTQLNIIHLNEAVEKLLSISSLEVVRKPLLEVISLADQNGTPADKSSLYIDKILLDSSTRIVTGFYLRVNSYPKPLKVTIQVRPISDSSDRINQIVFVILHAQEEISDLSHNTQRLSMLKYAQLGSSLSADLISTHLANLASKFELYKKIGEDISLTRELETKKIEKLSLVKDVALISRVAFNQELLLAKALGVKLNFNLPNEEVREESFINLSIQDPSFNPEGGPAEFLAFTDPKWFDILIKKLLEISILLSSSKPPNTVSLNISLLNSDRIDISIISSCPDLGENLTKSLLTNYYGELVKVSKLALGSGLEGAIARSISEQLSLPIKIHYNQIESSLTLNLQVSKKILTSPEIDTTSFKIV